jgi:hypothetical protein
LTSRYVHKHAKGCELARKAAPLAKGSGELSNMCIWKTSTAKDLNQKRERREGLIKKKKKWIVWQI